MVVTFRAHGISRGTRKLARTLMLIKKIIFLFPCLIKLKLCRLTFLSERKEIEIQANLILTPFVFTVFLKEIEFFLFFSLL
jgi:hypothetical protein